MYLGVLLNRVFRINNNSLFDYVLHNQDKIKKLYLIIPLEDLSDAGKAKQDYYESVASGFINSLQQHNIHPYIVPYKTLPTLANQLELSHILIGKDIMSYHHDEYDFPHLKSRFNNFNIKVIGKRVNHYFKPSSTLNKQLHPYKIFTSFYKANRKYIAKRSNRNYDLKQLSQIAEKGSNQSKLSLRYTQDLEEMALKDWQNFLDFDISSYKDLTNDISNDYVSGLSIYLAFGLVDIQEIINDLLNGYDSDEVNYEAYIRELMFREFYYILMTYYPATATQSFNKKYRTIQWSEHTQNFEAWKNGETGFPIVDAAMQKLKQTGFMHNRLRMIVSQFLTKDLFIEWTLGECYFRKYLIDYDNASNVHGWQWSASTGTDAAPYFRMFNPVRQSERFDLQGDFIKSRLSIFKNIPSKFIHDPTSNKDILKSKHNITVGIDYPKALIDHKLSRDLVIETFKSLK
ncbi:DNA photolyase family protein [Staphylococcus succinus]|uniref:cryptochrome/photolyase family protein n=1 Tax=Staphylococcus succinus TaxID=61015 RepID=UPI002DBAD7B1|nr:deoxyribodipyrimidine photo-lyase [Staphylococcus succinus]MEB7462595.1 DNA photolyase family protein [Staphylococcus succinus]